MQKHQKTNKTEEKLQMAVIWIQTIKKKKSKSQVYKLIYLGNKHTLPKRKY